MKKSIFNNRGFTLIELMVAMVILALVTVMALPQITNLVDSNSDRQFEVYEDSVLTSAKLYTDANNEDMFESDSGCYNLTFTQMLKKRLIKDVSMSDATCTCQSKDATGDCVSGSNDSYVRVYKVRDTYKYEVNLLCTKKGSPTTYVYSTWSPPSGTCDGKADSAPPEIRVETKDEHMWHYPSAAGFKAVITITDPYGIKANAVVKYAWTPKGTAPTSFTTVNFQNPAGKQKISYDVTSTRPVNASVSYDLVVAPVSLADQNNLITSINYTKTFEYK